MGQPNYLAPEALATYGPAHIRHFFSITTMGAAAVLASCGLLRLLAHRWRRGGVARFVLGAVLAATLATTAIMAEKTVLVEIPAISPYMAENFVVPTLHQCLAAAVLLVLFVGAVARQWSGSPGAISVEAGGDWRRHEERYYHERRATLLLLAGAILAWFLLSSFEAAVATWRSRGLDLFSSPLRCGWLALVILCMRVSWQFSSPLGCGGLALLILCVQGAVSRQGSDPDAAPTGRPRLAPRLFLLTGAALLLIIACGVPILAAWGCALWLKLGQLGPLW